MRRRLARLVPGLLALCALVAGGVAWRTEAGSAVDAAPAGAPTDALRTPVLSVRRIPAVVAAPVADRRLRADLAALVPWLPADSCLVVEGAGIRVAHRGEVPLVPASTQKLLVATAALEALGSAHRFRTAAVAAGAPVDGALAGDLTLVGGGDPLLATADYVSRFRRQPQLFTDLDGLADSLVDAGVRRVEGSVVGDDARYDRQRYVAGWPARYRDQHVIGPLSALSVNDGFRQYPTADAPGVALAPAADPAVEAAAVLTRLLRERGVVVAGPPRSGAAPADATTLAAIESAPLPDVLAQLLLESDNSTAELLLKELGRTAGDPSTAGGSAVVLAVLGDDAASGGGTLVADGSGLSLDDRASCDLLVDLLQRPVTGPLLRDRLPTAGRTGTLDRRFAGTPLDGVFRAKTGSLNTVAALAGVVDDGDPVLTFALIVNVTAPARVPASVADLQQAVGEVLVAWPRVPDLAQLGPLAQDG